MILSGMCAYNPLQHTPESSPPVSSDLSPTVTFEVRFVEPTPTATLSIEETATEEPTPERAFENDRPLAARVNGQPIFLNAFESEVLQLKQGLEAEGVDFDSNEGQSRLTEIRQQALEILVEQLIIEQQAGELGISVTQEEAEALALEAAQTQAHLERWLTENQLTYNQFVDQLRAQLIANRVFEHITQNISNQSDGPESQERLYEQKKQIFDDWLLKQKSAADIEMYVAL